MMPVDTGLEAFPHPWSVEILTCPPLIAPARQFTYPMQIAGEEDALARGALQLLIRPHPGASPFLATCALGFRDPAMPTVVLSAPNPRLLCAIAGGYAYLIDTEDPATATHIQLKPVTSVLSVPKSNLLLFIGFHTIQAWNAEGLAWSTGRLTWDGIQLGAVEGHTLHGQGWHMPTDREVPFEVDLHTGSHTGGGFQSS